jgi:hypothetical protein
VSRPTKTVSFYHLTTTAAQSQAYSATADVTARCDVLSLDRKDAILAGQDLVDPWELYCPVSANILLQDKVTIAGDTSNYYVRHVFPANFGGLPHKRVTVSKQL